MENQIEIPGGAVVVLVGPPGAGKSTFAAKHFKATQIVSLDDARAAVSDDAGNQSVTADAVALTQLHLELRLKNGRTTVLDSTNLTDASLASSRKLASKYGAPRVAIVLDTPRDECQRRNAARSRVVPANRLDTMYDRFEALLPVLGQEGFAAIHRVDGGDVVIVESPRSNIHPDVPVVEASGFDVIGDVHGCSAELKNLLVELGYSLRFDSDGAISSVIPPTEGRMLAFVGDLVDRGPDSLTTVRSVMRLVGAGQAVCALGNHDSKAARAMRPVSGLNVKRTSGLDVTMAQLEREVGFGSDEWNRIRDFLLRLPPYAILKVAGEPDLILSHAGLAPGQVGQEPKKVRDRCMYGDVRGLDPSTGYPHRSHEWTRAWDRAGEAHAVFGHTPQEDGTPLLSSNSANVDTACVFGGNLTAMQWPGRAVVQVPALATYALRTTPAQSPPAQAAAENQAVGAPSFGGTQPGHQMAPSGALAAGGPVRRTMRPAPRVLSPR